MTDTKSYLKSLLETDPLMKAVVRSVIRKLEFPQGSRGLDIGCGIGTHVMMMADEVGADGHITGIDIEPVFLDYARNSAKKLGLSERVSFQKGSMYQLPFKDNTFDWAWSANLVGYQPADQVSLLKEIIRVVDPGGTIALLIYSSQMLLPGYPVLEATLNATSSGIAPFSKGMRPESHSLWALGWFREAGLKDVRASTFVETIQAPLSQDIRNGLTALIQMRWVDVEKELSEKDWADYQRLCGPDSSDFILNYPDYYAFFTYSMFRGRIDK